MPIMTRMRDSMPVILITLVVAFLLTIIFEWGMDYLGLSSQRADHLGKINDRTITYQEFTELVRQAADNQKAQTDAEPDEHQLTQIRDQVWNQLVNQTLVEEELQRMGITVTDQEIQDWVYGPNPPEFLKRQFTDSAGVFNRVAYENALRDPQNRDVLVNVVEKHLRNERLQAKLQSVLMASVRTTEEEVFQRFTDQNLKLDVEYILFDPNRLIKDEEVQITDVDIRKFYNEHSDDYKVDATRKLKYVFFRDEPSAQDTQGVLADLQDVLRRVTEGADFVETASQYGQVQNSPAFFKHGELSQVKDDAILSAKVGQVVGPLKDIDGFHLIKVLEERQGKEGFLRASHILIKPEDNDTAGTLKLAREVAARAKRGEKFEELAAKYSKDPGSASRGGDLGWFGRGRMVKPFEEAAFKARPGEVVGPVFTQFGYHIIKVTHRSKREVRIADLGIPVKTGSPTRTAIYQKAQDFAYLAKQNGFTETVTEVGFTVSETPSFAKGASIPGIGINQTLTKFAFDGKVGDISDVITVQFGYGVFMISDSRPAGVRPLDEVKDGVRPRALRGKKMERLKVLADEIHAALQPGDSLGKGILGYSYQAQPGELRVQRTGQFSPGGFVPGLGRDLTFVGAALGLKAGELSKPIEGLRGYYLMRLLERTPVDSAAYQAQRGTLLAQMTQEKRTRFINEWLEQLRKDAEIEDNRDLFFR